MQKIFCVCLVIIFSGCSHFGSLSKKNSSPEWSDDVRMAQAQIESKTDQKIQGQVNFEQMPNSVIVTFHIEGLMPKGNYQLFLHPDRNCGTQVMTSTPAMTTMRANTDGIAQNTFKIQDLKVAGPASLAGDIVVLTTSPKGSKVLTPVEVACGPVRPQTAGKN